MPPPSESPENDTDAVIRRLGLLFTAVIAWQTGRNVWELGNASTDAISLALMIGLNGAGVVLAAMAVWVRPTVRAALAIPLVLAVVVFAYGKTWEVMEFRTGIPLTTDGRMFLDEAAMLVRDGANPYAVDLRESYPLFRAPTQFNTPLADGDYTGRMPYPVLSALVNVPFQLVGIDTKYVYPFFLVVCLALLWTYATPRWRPLVLLPFFAEDRYLLFSFGGVSDAIWASLLLVTVAVWRRPTLRAVVFGLACAVKQQPWVTAPFLLIKVWHETPGTTGDRLRAMGWLVGVSVYAFVVVNLPFVVADPVVWFTGSLEPLRAKMITFGQGPSALAMMGVTNVPSGVWSLLSLAVMGWAFATYHRHYHRFPELPWVIPAAILFVGHRSLMSYWYYAAFPAMLAITMRASLRVAPATPDRSPSPVPAVAGFGAILAAAVAAMVAFAAVPSSLDLAVVGPRFSNGASVYQLSVWVYNGGDRELTPRFQVQSDNGQAHFWEILDGPVTLDPGEGAVYRVHADQGFKVADTRLGGHVMVADAGDPSWRTSASIVGGSTWQFPDAVPNGMFRDWDASGVPAVWGVAPSHLTAWKIVPMMDDGSPARLGLQMEVRGAEEPASLELVTKMALPYAPITLSVFVPTMANQLPDLSLRYGVSLRVNETTVWVLFGDERATFTLPDDTLVVMLPVDREEWVTVRLDLRRILTDAGVSLRPTLDHLPRFETLDYPMVHVDLGLMVGTDGLSGSFTAPFGGIANGEVRPDPDLLYAEWRDHPEWLERWLGEHNFRARNYDKAAFHYGRAAAFDPTDGQVWYRYGEALFWADRQDEAIAAFRHCHDIGYEEGMAWKGIAWAEATAGRYDAAATSFQAALDTFKPDMPGDLVLHVIDAHIGLVRSLDHAGRCDEIPAAVQALLDLDPRQRIPEDGLVTCAGVDLPSEPELAYVWRADRWDWLEPAPEPLPVVDAPEQFLP